MRQTDKLVDRLRQGDLIAMPYPKLPLEVDGAIRTADVVGTPTVRIIVKTDDVVRNFRAGSTVTVLTE